MYPSLKKNTVDPDHLAYGEAIWSKSTPFSKLLENTHFFLGGGGWGGACSIHKILSMKSVFIYLYNIFYSELSGVRVKRYHASTEALPGGMPVPLFPEINWLVPLFPKNRKFVFFCSLFPKNRKFVFLCSLFPNIVFVPLFPSKFGLCSPVPLK